MTNQRQKLELADILRGQAETFGASHPLHPVQRKAFQAIMSCRTATLGGHTQRCDSCGHTAQSYNSCRNRHCPKCQFIKKAKWVDKLAGNLPPVKYFHLVFTIPECLHKLFYTNQQEAYGLLFKAAGATLMRCAENTKYLGAKAGAVAVLHTWGQTMVYHPHIHMMVPAGGLSEDASEWIPSGTKFFLPVKVLSAVFRGTLCRLLEKAVEVGAVGLPDDQASFQQLKERCYKRQWVVYSEKPFSNPDNLIRYLGSYTHRVAISNSRLVEQKGGRVSFYYKDNKAGGLRRVMTLDEGEFVRRFLQHVLPCGFSKIRYFGILSLRNLQSSISQCAALLGKEVYLPVLEGLSGYEAYRMVTGRDPICCPVCKAGRMRAGAALKPAPS